jgi:RimJ/RimL family protein N-acetyltransferase
MVNYHHREAHNRRLEVGYILCPKRQGKGLMTEAMRAHLATALKTWTCAASRP